MKAKLLPVAWAPVVGGFCFEQSKTINGVIHGFPLGMPDVRIERYPNAGAQGEYGEYRALLPLGQGLGSSPRTALARAMAAQHLALQLEREQAIHDATSEHYAARAARLLHAVPVNEGECGCTHAECDDCQVARGEDPRNYAEPS